MKRTTKKIALATILALPLLLVVADEYPALRFRGDGQFSGGPVFGYWVRLKPIPFWQEGEYGRSALTNLSTQLEAVLTDQKGRVVCAGAGVVPKEGEPCDDCKIRTD